MSDSKVREQFEEFMVEGDRSGYTRESLAWVCWLASRADALKEAEEACKKVARDAAESGLSRPFNFVDGAYHAAEAVSALAGRGA